MAGNLQPLVNTQRIVNLDGTPNDYFIRWAQQRQIDIGNGITAAQALEIIQQFTADHPLVAGSGIILTPSGDLADDVHIGASVQAILDQITTTRGSVLYRGASGWAGLAPGTAGQVLQANGAGTDPTWATGGGGGGGSLVKIAQTIVSGSAAANIAFAGIPATYDDLVIIIDGQLSGAADFVWASLNGDTAANYHWARGFSQTSGVGFGTGTSTGLDAGLLDGAGTLAGTYGGVAECTIYNYARTDFRKRSMARSSLRTSAAAAGLNTEIQSSEWSSTAAVNSITLTPNSGSFNVGTVATLYGRGGATGSGGSSGGSLFAINAPPIALSTPANWINQGGSTMALQTDGAITLVGALDGTDQVRGIFMPLPATPWAYTVGWIPEFMNVNYQNCGVALRESSTGKLVIFGTYQDGPGGSGTLFFIANYNSPSSKNANVLIPASPVQFNKPVYLRISDDGVTRKAGFGFDPYYQPFASYSLPHNSFIVPDQIGIYTGNLNASNQLGMSVFSWK